jgi:hypothetical protein
MDIHHRQNRSNFCWRVYPSRLYPSWRVGFTRCFVTLWTQHEGVFWALFLRCNRIAELNTEMACYQQKEYFCGKDPACNPYREIYRSCHPGYLLIGCEDPPHDIPLRSWTGKAYPLFSMYVSKIDTQTIPFKFRIYITIRWVRCRQWNLVWSRQYSGENPKKSPVIICHKKLPAIPLHSTSIIWRKQTVLCQKRQLKNSK